jgi:formate hydrogenlyase subunit 3/multisubunit Na+/H+ antiporter MnhD subunit
MIKKVKMMKWFFYILPIALILTFFDSARWIAQAWEILFVLIPLWVSIVYVTRGNDNPPPVVTNTSEWHPISDQKHSTPNLDKIK